MFTLAAFAAADATVLRRDERGELIFLQRRPRVHEAHRECSSGRFANLSRKKKRKNGEDG